MNQGAYPTPPNARQHVRPDGAHDAAGAYRLKALGFRLRTVFSNKRQLRAVPRPVGGRDVGPRARCSTSSPASLAWTRSKCGARTCSSAGDLPTSMVTGPDITPDDAAPDDGPRAGAHRLRRLPRRSSSARGPKGGCWASASTNLMEFAPGRPNFFPSVGMPAAVPEQASVRLEIDGHVTVFTAQAPHGQSHETTLAQIVADEIGVPFDAVRVVHGDTGSSPFSLIGTGGSRASSVAVRRARASRRARVKDKVLRIAAGMLEVSADDLEIVDGLVRVKGAPDKAVPLGGVAHRGLHGAAHAAEGRRDGRRGDLVVRRRQRRRLGVRHPRVHRRGRPRHGPGRRSSATSWSRTAAT